LTFDDVFKAFAVFKAAFSWKSKEYLLGHFRMSWSFTDGLRKRIGWWCRPLLTHQGVAIALLIMEIY
jgi:hypothetical protein